MSSTQAAALQGRLKERVRDFWSEVSCGEVYAIGASFPEALEAHAAARYRLEPYIPTFARFPEGHGRDVLEVGVGMGADHLQWAQARPRSLAGVDLTQRAIDHTRARLKGAGLRSDLRVGDAERLPFADASFDIVYAWGVIHHSPDTPRSAREMHRVLRPGGVARVMIYHTYSVVSALLWVRYALLTGRPRQSLEEMCAHHLQGPGRKSYTIPEARQMFADFSRVDVVPQISFGDLLQGAVGQRHNGPLLAAARKVWPRWLIRTALRRHGLYLLIEAVR